MFLYNETIFSIYKALMVWIYANYGIYIYIKKIDLHVVFIDSKKAYGKMLGDIIWWVLEKMEATKGYVDAIENKYDELVM